MSFRAVVAVALAVAAGCSGTARKPSDTSALRPLPLRRLETPADRFEGGFRARLSASDSSRRFVALVDLTEQLDLRTFARHLRAASVPKATARAAVVSALESVASRQQAKLRPLLDRLLAGGSISYAHPVAVVNRLIVEGTASGLLEIGSSDEVAAIRPDWTSERGASRTEDAPVDPGAPLGASFRSWAIDAMKADRLWRLGFDGTGVVVATIDTGAFEAHEQLRERRVPGERGWFDPVEGSTVANDRHGHGTGVLSQAVGGNSDGRVVGVAPGAHWASALEIGRAHV